MIEERERTYTVEVGVLDPERDLREHTEHGFGILLCYRFNFWILRITTSV